MQTCVKWKFSVSVRTQIVKLAANTSNFKAIYNSFTILAAGNSEMLVSNLTRLSLKFGSLNFILPKFLIAIIDMVLPSAARSQHCTLNIERKLKPNLPEGFRE